MTSEEDIDEIMALAKTVAKPIVREIYAKYVLNGPDHEHRSIKSQLAFRVAVIRIVATVLQNASDSFIDQIIEGEQEWKKQN